LILLCPESRSSQRRFVRMQFLLALFLGDFDDDHNGNGSSSASSPPVTPQERFESICHKIESNDSNLKSLDLAYNHVDFPRLARSLACCTVFQDLSLKETMLSKLEHDIQTFFREGLGRNRSLVSLNLTGNPLNVEGVGLLQASLKEHVTLQVLKLSRCQLRDTHLQEVGRIGMQLRELDLSKNILTDFGSLSRILSENPWMETLDLSNNHLRDGEDFLRLEVVSPPNNICSLNLSSNRFTPASADALCRLLLDFEGLVDLNLSWNDLGDDGVALLAQRVVAGVQKVNLTRCGLTPRGACHLAETLRGGGSVLQELSLTYNNIHEEGVQALVGCPTSIQVLDVQRTNFTGEDVVKALARNTNLHRLVHNRNPIKKAVKREIAFWTELNASGARRLVMGDHRIPPGFWPYILEKLNISPSVLYYLLRQKLDMCLFRRQEQQG
jgi:Ran GTPase-activating protein (RanGAP) involved in mRNA processing and transport